MSHHARDQQQEEEEAGEGCSGEHVYSVSVSQIQMCLIHLTTRPEIFKRTFDKHGVVRRSGELRSGSEGPESR